MTRLAGRLHVVVIDGAAHVGGAAHGGGVGDWMPVSCRSRVAGAEDEAALFGGGVADSVA